MILRKPSIIREAISEDKAAAAPVDSERADTLEPLDAAVIVAAGSIQPLRQVAFDVPCLAVVAGNRLDFRSPTTRPAFASARAYPPLFGAKHTALPGRLGVAAAEASHRFPASPAACHCWAWYFKARGRGWLSRRVMLAIHQLESAEPIWQLFSVARL